MYRFSNTVIGFLNLFTLLASIPIIGGGLWMARSSTTCEGFLQTPLLVVGFVVLVISLAGFIGACFHVAWALWVYLVVMLFLIATLMGLTIFGFVVTSQGGGVQVPGRSGCCKPPTSCTYNTATMVAQDPDCYQWNNAPTMLCYECDSCKAGVLEDVRRDWRKLSVLNIVMLVFLIGIYSIGCGGGGETEEKHFIKQKGERKMLREEKISERVVVIWWYKDGTNEMLNLQKI
ncbi:hypothetical protein Patl1_06139 [Pistacia atlantica]|uniref:Uncharacterized protein n=1 Tax=Pistacia atlantica TaxID=434234 RepID=A0ACC1BS66_9ROSI|nr:hypothetical protein Patl1_06139 [Pistacia atlantica]